ncbi:MAG: hypothetical protein R3A46_03095 [Thermomicrobiales bacterium]
MKPAALAYIEPELLTLPEGTIEAVTWMRVKRSASTATLETILRQRDHVLDTGTETLLAGMPARSSAHLARSSAC